MDDLSLAKNAEREQNAFLILILFFGFSFSRNIFKE